jgi:CO dehydrogenase/acetyl-CoA synthase beta subunit
MPAARGLSETWFILEHPITQRSNGEEDEEEDEEDEEDSKAREQEGD